MNNFLNLVISNAFSLSHRLCLALLKGVWPRYTRLLRQRGKRSATNSRATGNTNRKMTSRATRAGSESVYTEQKTHRHIIINSDDVLHGLSVRTCVWDLWALAQGRCQHCLRFQSICSQEEPSPNHSDSFYYCYTPTHTQQHEREREMRIHCNKPAINFLKCLDPSFSPRGHCTSFDIPQHQIWTHPGIAGPHMPESHDESHFTLLLT